VVISEGSRQCLACCRRNHAAAKKQKHCKDCGGVIVEKWARRCRQCSELLELRERAEKNRLRYANINVGRELFVMFPDLRPVVARELRGYVGEQRRNKRKEVLAKIGAEGSKMFKLKEMERQ
jgi:hypothetical protein